MAATVRASRASLQAVIDLLLNPFASVRSFVPGLEKIASEYHVGNYVMTRGDNPVKVWEVRRRRSFSRPRENS